MNWWKLAMTKTASSLRGQWWIVDGVAHRAGHDSMPAHGRWAIEMAEKEIAPAEMEVIGRHEKEMMALGMSMDDALARRLGGSPLWILESHVMDMGRTDEDRMDEEEMEKVGEMDEQRKRLVNAMMEEARAAVPKDLWKAAHSGSGYEATEWLMGRGGMTVSGVNIAMPSASFDSLRSLAKAMEAVVPDIDDESTVNIDVKSGSGTTHYEKVPWSVVRTGNTGALMGRGDR